jgi:phosphatidylglycerol:prolipoprotein diacylglycerol transferase
MTFLLHATAMLAPGFLRLGGLHVPVYGVFAAAALVAALWLSQRTASHAGIAPETLWDAGVFAVVAAFVASRLLLVVFDFHSFLRFPLLVLALPSLTYAGMALTAVAVFMYLRRKRLAVLDVLDAWAPCVALMAAVLSVGDFVAGSNAGMPTQLPWGVVSPLGRVHPVQLYAAALDLGLCVLLFRMLSPRKFAGRVAAFGLAIGGLVSFLLAMLRQPVESFANSWLEPSQYVSLGAIAAGSTLAMLARSQAVTPCTSPQRPLEHRQDVAGEVS